MASWFGRLVGVVCSALCVAGSAAAQGAAAPGTTALPAPAPAPAPANAAFAPTPAPATAPPAESASPAAECFPACRSGFTCHAGQCVSLCNPPCASGDRCLANGECEAVAPPVDDDAEDDEPRRRHRAKRDAALQASADILRAPGKWVFAARAGFQLLGGGHVKEECQATGPGGCDAESRADVDDKSWFTLGLDAMIHAAPGLRLGVGYQLVPYSSLRDDEGAEEAVHLGHEHGLDAIVEGVLPLGPRIGLVLRAQGGLRMLVIGGDLADRDDEFLRRCHDENAVHCEVDQGPLFGTNYGVMLGLIGGNKVHWRVDLALDRFALKLPSTKIILFKTPELGFSTDTMLYGTRTWIMGGVEL